MKEAKWNSAFTVFGLLAVGLFASGQALAQDAVSQPAADAALASAPEGALPYVGQTEAMQIPVPIGGELGADATLTVRGERMTVTMAKPGGKPETITVRGGHIEVTQEPGEKPARITVFGDEITVGQALSQNLPPAPPPGMVPPRPMPGGPPQDPAQLRATLQAVLEFLAGLTRLSSQASGQALPPPPPPGMIPPAPPGARGMPPMGPMPGMPCPMCGMRGMPHAMGMMPGAPCPMCMMGGMSHPLGMMARPTAVAIAVSDGKLYIMQGGTVYKFDAQTLNLEKQRTFIELCKPKGPPPSPAVRVPRREGSLGM